MRLLWISPEAGPSRSAQKLLNLSMAVSQGSLKDLHLAHLKHGPFPPKIEGDHHLQGNVQVCNVRIPVG